MNYQDLAVHTFTTKPWSIDECIEGYARRGIGGISIWRETVKGEDLCSVARQVRARPLVQGQVEGRPGAPHERAVGRRARGASEAWA